MNENTAGTAYTMGRSAAETERLEVDLPTDFDALIGLPPHATAYARLPA